MSHSFRVASERIKNDDSCVKQILKANGYCFRYLNMEQHKDEELMRIAVQNNPMILKVVLEYTQYRRNIIQLAKHFYGIIESV